MTLSVSDNIERLWIFRSNLRIFEYYHKINNLAEFKEKCHDFYLLLGLELLRTQRVQKEVIIWRQTPPNVKPFEILFSVKSNNGSVAFFRQKFVSNFSDCFLNEKPDITLFRGGFPEYDDLVKRDKEFFGLSLYLPTGIRVKPIYGGSYDEILIESLSDFSSGVPFYKTANPEVFFHQKHSLKPKEFDLILPSNFSNSKQKGQEYFITQVVAISSFLKSLKILHAGNEPSKGTQICNKVNVTNIHFLGWQSRKTLNFLFNKSKFVVITSTKLDGCPRTLTEAMCSGTPVCVYKDTRALPYYENIPGFERFETASDLERIIKDNEIKEVIVDPQRKLDFSTIVEKNFSLWFKSLAKKSPQVNKI